MLITKKYVVYVAYILSYVLAHIELGENLLIRLTTLQKANIFSTLEELKPKFEISTYLIDPISTNLCYIFIENTYLKEIKHFTLNLNDDLALQNLKNEILNNIDNSNNIFDMFFLSDINIQNEISKFSKILILFFNVKLNDMLKQIFNNFFVFIRNIDKTNLVKLNINNDILNFMPETIMIILNGLNRILLESYKVDYSNISIFKSAEYNLKCLNILNKIISDKLDCVRNFASLCLNKKINEISKVSACGFIVCEYRKLCFAQIMKYLLEKINLVQNKLNKYTYILCFCKIINDTSKIKIKTRVLNLLIFLKLDSEKKFININNKESLILLNIISKVLKKNYIVNVDSSEMCFLDDMAVLKMRNILILRYIYFTFSYRDFDLAMAENVTLYSQYSEFFWLIIKCCTKTTYNIFQIKI